MMKKLMHLILVSCLLAAAGLSAAGKVVCAPKVLADWQGYKPGLLDDNGMINTNRKLYVLFTKQNVPIVPGKTYTLKGDFKLNPYAPFGNILFGLMFFNAQDKEVPKRAYIGASPFDDSICPGNESHVRDFWLTFSGKLPAGKFVIPKGATYMKIILHQRADDPVDMVFKNIILTEE